MAYSEDVGKVFHRKREALGRSEILLYDRRLVVISGHKGLISLSGGEIVIRLPAGRLVVTGDGLFARKASPSEIYVEGRIDAVTFPGEAET